MAYKSREVKTTIAAAVGDAFAEFQSLGEEMRETHDNMEGANMGHMDKCQRAGEAADELESHDSEPDVPGFLAEVEVKTTELVNKNKRRGPSRSTRLSNAQTLLQAARDAAEEYKEKLDADLETSDSDAKVDAKEEEVEAKKDEIDSFISDLDEHCDFDVDFPGMFG